MYGIQQPKIRDQASKVLGHKTKTKKGKEMIFTVFWLKKMID